MRGGDEREEEQGRLASWHGPLHGAAVWEKGPWRGGGGRSSPLPPWIRPPFKAAVLKVLLHVALAHLKVAAHLLLRVAALPSRAGVGMPAGKLLEV